MTEQITVPKQTWDAMRGAFKPFEKLFKQMTDVHPTPTNFDCQIAVRDLRALIYSFDALTAANAVQPQAQGEPVEAIRLSDTVEGSHPSFGGGVFATLDAVDIFYAAPKALAPLTDEQIYNVFASTVEEAEPFSELVVDPIWAEVVEITRAIEAAHGITKGTK